MKFMLRVEIADRSEDYAVLRAPGTADAIGGPYALVTYDELDDMKSAFSQNYLQVGTWALDAERVAAGRARILFETFAGYQPWRAGSRFRPRRCQAQRSGLA